MKSIITIFVFVFFYNVMQSQTQWNKVSTPIDSVYSNFNYLLNVIDSLNVILTPRYTFDSPNLLKTTDGGQTWNSHIIDSTMYTILHEAEFVNANVGYIVGGTDFGDWRILLKTTNGGQTWERIIPSFLPSLFPTQISELSFINDQVGFIARSTENTIYRTTDGGVNFIKLDLPQISNGIYSYTTEVKFISPYVGFVARILTSDHINCTNEILKTTDGGTTWALVNSIALQNLDLWEKKDKVQFVNNLQGFTIVGVGVLKTTQDGGNSWQDYSLPVTNKSATDMYFVNNATGYIALDGNIYRTNDAGVSWSLQTIENSLHDVKYLQFANESFGYALNNEPSVQGLKNTTLLKTKQQPAASLSLESLDTKDSFVIYPNPADNMIFVQNPDKLDIQFIHLMDVSGRIIKTYTNQMQELDVSAIAAGNYLLLIQASKKKVVKKVIIK